MTGLFARLGHAPFIGVAQQADFIAAAAEFLAELNAIHPFREGNGRCQLSFMALLGARAGHFLDMRKVRAAPILQAMTDSFSGAIDGLKRELAICCVEPAPDVGQL